MNQTIMGNDDEVSNSCSSARNESGGRFENGISNEYEYGGNQNEKWNEIDQNVNAKERLKEIKSQRLMELEKMTIQRNYWYFRATEKNRITERPALCCRRKCTSRIMRVRDARAELNSDMI